MSVFKTTFSRALPVIRTDSANIPFPAPNSTGTNTSVSGFLLIDSAATFITDGVKTGDIVYNTTDTLAATVVSVISETELILNAGIFLFTDKVYTIYQASSQTTIGNAGCYLYVGVAGNIKVTTIGQDILLFTGVQAGTVLPVQVTKVWAVSGGTSANQIVALW
tara:strand:- start:557 stop:1048 length:492 start_codon:yes stop_codon:yes gene_type:complete